MLMFGEAGAEIIYPNPGFPIYQSAIEFTGATAVAMPLHEDTGFSFKADEVLDLISPNTRLIILNSPANPTGGVTPREEIERLVNGLSAHPDVYIMSDEIYARMLYDGREHVSLLEFEAIRDRVILLDGWSKTYAMTGWRMGYGVWPKTLIEGATRLAINCHSCVNAASQFAGIAALEGPQSDVDDMVQAFDRRRGIIVEALNQIPGITCAGSGGAFYAFANTSGTGIGSMALQDKFLNEAGVATLSGTSFGHMGEGYLRFSYANSVDNIKTAIQRIRECL
jgi:aspartate/methionine/tyrosine aminotransferase